MVGTCTHGGVSGSHTGIAHSVKVLSDLSTGVWTGSGGTTQFLCIKLDYGISFGIGAKVKSRIGPGFFGNHTLSGPGNHGGIGISGEIPQRRNHLD